MTRANQQKIDCDTRILIIFVILTAIGVCLVASSSSFFSSELSKTADPYFLIKKHLIRLFIAVVFFLIAIRIDYRFYRKISIPVYIISIALLVGLFLFGKMIRGSVRCYYIEYIKLTLQPADVAEMALIFIVAFWIARKGKDLSDLKRDFLPPILLLLLVVGLVAAQPNYGSAAAVTAIVVVMLYVGGAKLKHLLSFCVLIGVPAAIKMWNTDYIRERIIAFFNKNDQIQEANWQIYQSLIGMGSGGLTGGGWGGSKQKLNWLPDSHTDFIFSILGEEAGFLGTFFVSSLFLLLVLRALKIARSCGDHFGEMLGIGAASAIFIHASLNMAVASGLFPVTGLPLPFISYGGTSLVVNCLLIGMILNLSRKSHYTGVRRVRREP